MMKEVEAMPIPADPSCVHARAQNRPRKRAVDAAAATLPHPRRENAPAPRFARPLAVVRVVAKGARGEHELCACSPPHSAFSEVRRRQNQARATPVTTCPAGVAR